jgi:hypothetical protein
MHRPPAGSVDPRLRTTSLMQKIRMPSFPPLLSPLYICYTKVTFTYASPSDRAVYGDGLRPLACWDCRFESLWGHELLCVAWWKSLGRADPSFKGVLPTVMCHCVCVWCRNFKNWAALTHVGLLRPTKKNVHSMHIKNSGISFIENHRNEIMQFFIAYLIFSAYELSYSRVYIYIYIYIYTHTSKTTGLKYIKYTCSENILNVYKEE